MSLINEALKRSESDKRRNSSPYFDNLTVMMPDNDDEVPPPPRPRFEPRRNEKPPVSKLLILGLVATMAFGGWYAWSRSSGQVGPDEASADALAKPDKPQTVEQMRAAAKRVAPDPTLNSHNTDSHAGTKTSDRATLATDKNQDAFTAAMRQLERARKNDQAQTVKADELSPMVSEPLTSGGRPIKFRPARPLEGSQPRDVRLPATASKKPAEPKAPSPTTPVEPADPPAPPASDADTDTARPVPKPATPHAASKLRLTAIMRGPDGNVAIINGGLYRKGQTVKGATIVRIGQYEVELIADGKRFTIRI